MSELFSHVSISGRETSEAIRKKPKSFIVMKVSFKRRVFGVNWLVGQLVEINTIIPGEINQAAKLQRLKPRIRVMKPSVPCSQSSQSISMRSSGSSKLILDSGSSHTDSALSQF